MLITIILTAIFLICLVAAICTNGNYRLDAINFISIGGSIISGVVLCLCIGATIINYSTIEIHYENTLYEKEVLEYRLDVKSENLTGNELLYSEIVEFNNELRRVKRYANSPWTNWFNNHKIASIDYIEIGDISYANLVPIKKK